MSESEAAIQRLVAAVADRDPIHWPYARAHALSHRDRARFRQLELIHRWSATHPAAGDAARQSQPWPWTLLMILAVFQAAAAVIASAGNLADASLLERFQVAILVAFGMAATMLRSAGRRDGRARSLSDVYLMTAASFSGVLLWRNAPASLSRYLLVANPESFMALAVWQFCREFPQPSRFTRFDRWASTVTRALLVAGVALFLNSLIVGRMPERAAAFHPWMWRFRRGDGGAFFWLTTLSLVLPSLGVSIWRFRNASTEEQRRARWFLAALIAGVAPLLTVGIGLTLSASFRAAMVDGSAVRQVIDPIVLSAILAVPFGTAYAIVVHRVLPVRLMVHRSIRYAFARHTLAIAVAVPLVAIALHAYRHPERRIGELLADRTVVASAVALAAGVVLFGVRNQVIARFDEMVLGRGLTATAAMTRLTEAVARGRTTREVVQEVAAHVADTLAVSPVVIWKRVGTRLQVLHGVAPDCDVDTAIVAMLTSTPALQLDAESAVVSLVPVSERDWLLRTRCELLVRVPATDGIAGIIGTGRRDIGYGKSELSYLTTVATTLGLALSRPWTQDPGVASAEGDGACECDRCGMVGASKSCSCVATARAAHVPLLLADKFAVRRRLGQGGMGVVYLAEDVRLRRPVALKTLPRVSGSAAAAMFVEGQSMAAVEHPHIAHIYGLEIWRDTPVLVVEYLGGGTLADRLREGPLTAKAALEMGSAVADGLAALHRIGVLHRDIKPSNVGFTTDGYAKLLDFGIARLTATASHPTRDRTPTPDAAATDRHTAAAGTPLYLPPEALNGAPPNAHVDLWGVSLVVLEALIGTYPFEGRHPASLIQVIRRGEAAHALRSASWVPREVMTFFESALDVDTRRRPSSAEQLSAAFRSLARRVEEEHRV